MAESVTAGGVTDQVRCLVWVGVEVEQLARLTGVGVDGCPPVAVGEPGRMRIMLTTCSRLVPLAPVTTGTSDRAGAPSSGCAPPASSSVAATSKAWTGAVSTRPT
ncbi:MAG: hypothetical protein GY708_09530 [Actinomycetia bacterium]|nr:hypothetical protein [Actinomycetes bacterium]MCP4960406.1 hypothetical protein [Actinomycetes bacterium]